MYKKTISFPLFVTIVLAAPSGYASMSGQLGFGYGSQFLGNTDIEQFEFFWRQSLPYQTIEANGWQISTALELSGALLRDDGSNSSDTGRFSLMPQVLISPHEMVVFVAGLGAGFMLGETKFDDHNLGGSFLFCSKLGVQLVLGEHWGLEYVYYHQSNASLYDYNNSLNMHQVALSYHF